MIALKSVNDFARQLSKTPAFRNPEQVGLSGLYRIYTAVPLKDIYRGAHLVCVDSKYSFIDLLICQGNDILLAVLFGTDDWRAKSWFGFTGILSGMQLVTLPCLELAKDKQQYFQTIVTSIQTAEDIADQELQCSEFSLAMTPLHEVIPQDSVDKLKTCELLTRDGSITPEGISYGLFQGISDDGTMTYFIAGHATRELLDRVFEVPSPAALGNNMTSLQERLSRIASGIPSDECCVQHIISSMHHLLEMPLEEYYRLSWRPPFPEKNLYNKLQNLIAKARAFLPIDTQADSAEQFVRTFGDVVFLVSTLYENTEPGSTQSYDTEDLCLSLLMTLCTPAVAHAFKENTQNQQGLNCRLNAINEKYLSPYQVFVLPIKHYVYGACILQQSVYPDWIYRDQLRGYMYDQNRKESEYTPMNFIRSAVEMYYFSDSANHYDAFHLLYALIVRPLAIGSCPIGQTAETRPKCKYD